MGSPGARTTIATHPEAARPDAKRLTALREDLDAVLRAT